MAANDYTRTVNITPLGTTYAWDTPPSWITITRVGSSNDWTITVSANGGSARSATLTVRHDNGSTTDTITVSQAGTGSGVGAGPTATPVPDPTATLVPTATPTSTALANNNPTKDNGLGTGPTPTPVPNPTATPYVSGGGGGVGGGCHLAGDLLTLANGETKKVEDIVLGDTLLSLAINGLSDVETIYREFNVSAADYSDEYTSAVVNDIYVDTYSSYYDINNGELQLTLEHPVLVKTSDDRVVFKVIKDVLVGDSMLNQNNEWVLVNSNVLVQTEAPFTTYAFNVENKDVYFASGILVHNVMDGDVDGKNDGFNNNIIT